MRYGTKKDANHAEIFDLLRSLGVAVYDMSAVGCGVPDGIAWVSDAWHLFDVKNPKTAYGRRGLNKVQTKWVTQWKGGPVYMIYTPGEAKQFARGQFDGLKLVRSGGEGGEDSCKTES